ncbi:hypothetical protein [Dapis sp. BLCC M229]|uniref:hypothetical protein n=1 Tax=Dapis sp. BLCC M229 TaxID=3400188 RepID=UPI003CFBC24E
MSNLKRFVNVNIICYKGNNFGYLLPPAAIIMTFLDSANSYLLWKGESGYHRRSLSETTMFRLKVIFGGKLRRRKFDNQAVELFIQCAVLNRIALLESGIGNT